MLTSSYTKRQDILQDLYTNTNNNMIDSPYKLCNYFFLYWELEIRLAFTCIGLQPEKYSMQCLEQEETHSYLTCFCTELSSDEEDKKDIKKKKSQNISYYLSWGRQLQSFDHVYIHVFSSLKDSINFPFSTFYEDNRISVQQINSKKMTAQINCCYFKEIHV